MAVTSSFSRIKEVVGTWDNIQRLLRSGDAGSLVPVVIPKDSRRMGWMIWFALAFYSLVTNLLLFGFGAAGIGLAVVSVLVFSSHWGVCLVAQRHRRN
jgi:hypothetical protein